MQFTDAVTVAGNAPDRRGYLIVEAKAVRTGIQLSLGNEVGKPDLRVVRVDRPAKEVFSDNGLQSFTHAPVTDNHPDEVVDAGNLSKQTELADFTQLFFGLLARASALAKNPMSNQKKSADEY